MDTGMTTQPSPCRPVKSSETLRPTKIFDARSLETVSACIHLQFSLGRLVSGSVRAGRMSIWREEWAWLLALQLPLMQNANFNEAWCRWGVPEHINRLEMRSILLALKWRVQHLGEVDCRFIHLTDSYVSMSVISKGRSSSDMLMSVMRKIAAYQFGFSLFPILIHVESTENPTDDASRL